MFLFALCNPRPTNQLSLTVEPQTTSLMKNTWKRLGIGRKELARPVTVHNVDGTENKQGKITHYCWLRIVKGEKHMLQRFYITALGKDRIILGYPFLYDFNPKINWKTGKVLGEPVQLQSSRYMHVAKRIFFMQREAVKQVGKPKEGEAIYMCRTNIAQEWARKADQNKIHLTLDTIPKEYRRHQKVFSEEEAHRFPPARSEDMTIKLTPDAPRELNYKVYPLSKTNTNYSRNGSSKKKNWDISTKVHPPTQHQSTSSTRRIAWKSRSSWTTDSSTNTQSATTTPC
jgi:hypothetical protein